MQLYQYITQMRISSRTVREAADAWLKRCKREGLDRQTIKTYRSQVEKHILPRIGDFEVAELRRANIRGFLDELLDENSRAMSRKVLVSLKSLLKEAVEREWIAASPAVDVTLKRQKRHEKRPEIPTKEEIRLFLTHAPDRYRPLITTAVFTGMRISELRRLTWDDVDFERRIIRVRARANRLNEMGSPKSRAGIRDIPMTPTEARALRNAMERGIGALLEARRASGEEQTTRLIYETIALMRETAAVDFRCPAQRAAYRSPGGCP